MFNSQEERSVRHSISLLPLTPGYVLLPTVALHNAADMESIQGIRVTGGDIHIYGVEWL